MAETWLVPVIAGAVAEAIAISWLEHRFHVWFAIRRMIASRRKRGACVSVSYRFPVQSDPTLAPEAFRQLATEEREFRLLSDDAVAFTFSIKGRTTTVRPDSRHSEVTVELVDLRDYWRNLPALVSEHAKMCKRVLERMGESGALHSAHVEVQAPYMVQIPQTALQELAVDDVHIEMKHKITATSVTVGQKSASFASDDVSTIVTVLKALL